MQAANFEDIIDSIREQDPRYAREAYHLVREALDFTQRKTHHPSKERPQPEQRHVTGQQLLEGTREFALQSFGPMALFVLHEWGIRSCADVGEIVFNLVDHGRGLFGKTETDTRSDFEGGYDFDAAFRHPFLPACRSGAPGRQMREA